MLKFKQANESHTPKISSMSFCEEDECNMRIDKGRNLVCN